MGIGESNQENEETVIKNRHRMLDLLTSMK